MGRRTWRPISPIARVLCMPSSLSRSSSTTEIISSCTLTLIPKGDEVRIVLTGASPPRSDAIHNHHSFSAFSEIMSATNLMLQRPNEKDTSVNAGCAQ